MKSVFQILILVAAVTALAGCGNPVDRQSNPLKDNNGISNDVPINTAKKGRLFCQSTYAVTIRSDSEVDSGPNLQFLVGQPKIYHIYVQSKLSLDLSLTGAPNGMDLTKINSSGLWYLHWQPKSSDSGATDTVKIVATAINKSGCLPAEIGQLHITANTGSLQPTITVTGINSNQPYGAKTEIPFTVNVEDPTLSSSSTPAQPTFDFPSADAKDKTPFLKAKSVVRCGPLQVLPTPWSFRCACVFEVDQVIGQNPTASGLGISEMVVNVKSTIGEAAVPYPVKLTISLPTLSTTATPGPASELESKIKSAAIPSPTKTAKPSTNTGVGT